MHTHARSRFHGKEKTQRRIYSIIARLTVEGIVECGIVEANPTVCLSVCVRVRLCSFSCGGVVRACKCVCVFDCVYMCRFLCGWSRLLRARYSLKFGGFVAEIVCFTPVRWWSEEWSEHPTLHLHPPCAGVK